MTVEQAETGGISADEVALYDRQIRLWGMAAQERMRIARVLVISIRGLANEVIKNLVLAGIGGVTLLDSASVSEDDLGAQFLVEEADIGRNRAEAAAEKARKLNPRVQVVVDTETVKQKDERYYGTFDVIVACDLGLNELITINTACRKVNKPFYAAEVPGMTGYIFADLISHNFTTEKEGTSTSGEKVKRNVSHEEEYSTLEEVIKHDYGSTLRPKQKKKVSFVLPLILALLEYRRTQHDSPLQEGDQEFGLLAKDILQRLGLPSVLLEDSAVIDAFVRGSDCEVSAVAAIVGGILSQDVLNVLSGREVPIQNFFIYDAHTGDGPIYKL